MPLINGVKMACEPCIRGHRSTKCTHANERLMVPVRKPGRPLSSCPHPASKPCTCAALMAAIPKSHKCPCGTAEEAAGRKTAETADRETSNGMVTPPSPAPKGTSAAPAYRVQKANSKSGPSKKQIDPANLERMDVNQLNILSSPELKSPISPTNGTMPTTPITAFPSYGMMGFVPNGNAYNPNPAMFPLYQQMASANPTASQAATKPMAPNGHPLVNGQGAVVAAKSCCGPAKSTLAQPNEQQAPKANGTNGVENQPKSCCSSRAEKSETKPQERMPTPTMVPQANGMMMPQFTNVPIAMPNGMYPYFTQPAIFAYPPQYGSYMQPLQPDQWRQLMTALSFGQQQPTNVQHNIPYSAPAPAPIPAPVPAQFQQSTSSEAESTWTAHHCSCGEGCQCIGCATHPYNTATQNYVRSAWNSMAEDSPKRHRHSDSVGTPSINGSYEMPTPSNQSPIGGSTPIMTKMEETASPTTAHTPSDATSTLGEELTLSANDFFFVSYPFGDICEGEMANCPCGDGCQCIGCAIHVTVQQGH
ncbi:hypothetical protein GGI43DRAFT_410148 [Trichoderma evansii]